MNIYTSVKALLSICFLTVALTLAAQKAQPDAMVQVDVTVVDSEGQTLPGATVQISGKSQGVISDADGHVSLWVDKGARIEFRYVGMKTVSMRVTKPVKLSLIHI